MKIFFFLVLLLFSILGFAQKARFEYDQAGNQILRLWCANCPERPSREYKELDDLTESDLLKFYPDDLITYYPNPVKSTLFLNWEKLVNIEVVDLTILSLNGQVLYQLEDLKSSQSAIVSFENYPAGVFILVLNLSDGAINTIKIIKN